ncbi:MAG: hypothetical protein Q4Q23_07905 [Methanobacteriaceae archaeon]|nr:hypothetical protein [Methanobacteriaceae archaeon]
MEEMVIITGYKDMSFDDKDGNKVDMLKLTCFSQNSGRDSIGYLPLQLTYLDQQKK